MTESSGGGGGASSAGATLLVALAGVQEFVQAARTTADVWAGSALRADLARVALDAIVASAATLVLPADDQGTVPNRIVARYASLEVACEAGAAAVDAVRSEWRALLDEAVEDVPDGVGALPALWIASGDERGYAHQWQDVQDGLVQRRRVRDFAAVSRAGGQLCPLCGADHVVPARRGVAAKAQPGEAMCASCWTKRAYRLRHAEGFPSTSTVASAVFRQRVLQHLGDHPVQEAVDALAEEVSKLRDPFKLDPFRRFPADLPGLDRPTDPSRVATWAADVEGAVFYEDSWQPDAIARDAGVNQPAEGFEEVCRAGARAAGALTRTMRCAADDDEATVLTPYLALLMLDGDRMGMRLSPRPSGAEVTPEWHREVSARLQRAAEAQRASVEAGLGRVVYAGGDDLVALVPVGSALAVAKACRQDFSATLSGSLDSASASVGLLVFHRSHPLRDAFSLARAALASAKAAGRNRLSLVVARRGSRGDEVILPWTSIDDRMAIDEIDALCAAFRSGRLSPGILEALHSEARGLAELDDEQFIAEVTRLLRRRSSGGAGEWAASMGRLARAASGSAGPVGLEAVRDVLAAVGAARFLARNGG